MSIRRTVDTNLYMEHHISAARHTYVQVRRINASDKHENDAQETDTATHHYINNDSRMRLLYRGRHRLYSIAYGRRRHPSSGEVKGRFGGLNHAEPRVAFAENRRQKLHLFLSFVGWHRSYVPS